MSDDLKDSTGKLSQTRKVFNVTMIYVIPFVIGVLTVCSIITALYIKDSTIVSKFLDSLISLCGIHVGGGTIGMASGHYKETVITPQ